MTAIWQNIFFEPLHNALVFLVGIMPSGDVGLAVIVLTVVVKLILFPLTQRSIESNRRMREIEPEIKKIKEEHKDKTEQAKKTFELYKEKKINPFAGCLIIVVQLPIIIALYWVFLKGLDFSAEKLYSFVSVPDVINMKFLGLIDMGTKSLILAILAGVSQFFQTWLSMPKLIRGNKEKPEGFQESLKKSMDLQMRYFLPVFIGFIAYKVQAAVALYWVVNNLFTIGQELITKNGRLKKNN